MSRLLDRYRSTADPLRSERRVEAALLLVCVLLGLQIVWGLLRLALPATPEPVQPTPESLRVAPLLAGGAPAPEARDELRARPLFWPGRSPLAAEAGADQAKGSAEPEQARPLKGVKLAGVFGAGEDAGVILLRKGEKQRLAVGQAIDGWTLDVVEPTAVRFTNAGRQAELTLERGAVSATVSPPPAAEATGRKDKKRGASATAKQQRKTSPDADDGPNTIPPGLGLGGGDRNRGKAEQ